MSEAQASSEYSSPPQEVASDEPQEVASDEKHLDWEEQPSSAWPVSRESSSGSDTAASWLPTFDESCDDEVAIRRDLEKFLDSGACFPTELGRLLELDLVCEVFLGFLSQLPEDFDITEDADDDRPARSSLAHLSSPAELLAVKRSFRLCQVLSEIPSDEVSAFVSRHSPEVLTHALSVFHGDSSGNLHHATAVLENAFQQQPANALLSLLEGEPSEALHHVLCESLHKGDVKRCLVDLLSASLREDSVREPRRNLMRRLVEWRWTEMILANLVGKDCTDEYKVANYASFARMLLERAPYIPGAEVLLDSKTTKRLVEALLETLASPTAPLWRKFECVELLNTMAVSFASYDLDPAGEPHATPALPWAPQPPRIRNRLHFLLPDFLNALWHGSKAIRQVLHDVATSTPAQAADETLCLAGFTVKRPMSGLALASLKLLAFSVSQSLNPSVRISETEPDDMDSNSSGGERRPRFSDSSSSSSGEREESSSVGEFSYLPTAGAVEMDVRAGATTDRMIWLRLPRPPLGTLVPPETWGALRDTALSHPHNSMYMNLFAAIFQCALQEEGHATLLHLIQDLQLLEPLVGFYFESTVERTSLHAMLVSVGKSILDLARVSPPSSSGVPDAAHSNLPSVGVLASREAVPEHLDSSTKITEFLRSQDYWQRFSLDVQEEFLRQTESVFPPLPPKPVNDGAQLFASLVASGAVQLQGADGSPINLDPQTAMALLARMHTLGAGFGGSAGFGAIDDEDSDEDERD